MEGIESALRMDTLYFSKLSFIRTGFGEGTNPLSCDFKGILDKNETGLSCEVTLEFIGKKEDVFDINIILVAVFSFADSQLFSDKQKCDLLEKNTISIMMPYLRSQISLMTTHPGIDCVVLPPFNVNAMFSNASTE